MNTPHHGRHFASALRLAAISACIIVAALLLGVVAPPPAQAESGIISGTIKDIMGNPVPDGKAYVYSSVDSNGNGVLSASAGISQEGTYTVSGLAPGSYRVFLNDNGHGDYVAQYYNGTSDGARTIEAATPVYVSEDTTTTVDAVLAPAGHITGKVTDASGIGLPHMKVYAYASLDDYYSGTLAGWAGTIDGDTTNDVGTYDLGGLPAGGYFVLFTDNEAGNWISQYYDDAPTIDAAEPVAVTVEATTTAINASLDPAGQIAGTVTNPSGEGLPGVKVSAYKADGSGGWQKVWGAVTVVGGTYPFGDLPRGGYRIGNLPPGSYRIGFADPAAFYLPRYYLEHVPEGAPTIESGTSVVVTAGVTTPAIDAVLVAGGRVSGTVTGPGDVGVANVRVDAFQADGQGGWNPVNGVNTESDGSYVLGGLPEGTYRVQFRDDSGSYVTQCYNDKANLETADNVEVAAGATTSAIDAVLVPGGHVSGTVTKAGGGGLANISVNAKSDDGSGDWQGVAGTRTDEQGNYDLGGLPEGTYRIEFRDDSGGYIALWADDVVVTAGTPNTVNAVLVPGGHVSGTVTKAGGGGLADISVNAVSDNGSGDWQWVDGTRTDEQGNYDLGGLPEGDYRIEFRDDENGDYVAQYYDGQATIEAADVVAVTFGIPKSGVDAELAPAGHISGTVTGPGSGPLADIYIFVCTPDGNGGWNYPYSVATAGDGSFDLGGLPAGTYRVVFWDPSGSFVTQYYDNKVDAESADVITVIANATMPDINAGLLAANTLPGTDQTVELPGDAALTFSEVSAPGVTTVAASSTDPGSEPAPFQVADQSFFEFTTTASYAGPISVALPYDPTGLTLEQQKALKLMHLDDGAWVDVTTSVDTEACIVHGSVLHLSWFALAVDTTPPSTTTNVNKTWYNADVPVVLTAIDGGSGVTTIQYKLGNASSWTSAIPNAQGQVRFIVGGEGRFTLHYRALDVAGNVEAQRTVSFGIDRHAPSTSACYDGQWHNADVRLSFAAGDGLSGVLRTESSADNGASWQAGASRTVSTEGQTSVLYRSLDEAGNTEAAHSVTVKIDRTAPVITLVTPVEGATYLLNQVVKANWSASDALSGLSGANATTPSGASIATSKVTKLDPRTGRPVGLLFTVTAIDRAGNRASRTVTYFVTYRRPTGFLAPIDANGASLFKLGSTVTVAFQLTDALGANVGNAAATIAVVRVSTTPHGTVSKPGCKTRPTGGTAFTYNSTSKQYVYYLGTNGLTAGDYRVTATLDDGTQVVGHFSLK